MITIITDAGAGITNEEAALHNIIVVPAYVHLGRECYKSDDISPSEILTWVEKTNQLPRLVDPTQEDWEQIYKNALSQSEDGDILSIHTSSRAGATYTTSTEAIKNLDIDSQSRIKAIDSYTASHSFHNVVMRAVDLSAQGDDIGSIIYQIRNVVPVMFTQTYLRNLEWLKKSGRINAVTMLLSSFLRVKPIIGMSNGEVVSIGRAMGSDAAMAKVLNGLKDYLENLNTKARVSFICSEGAEDEATEIQIKAKDWGLYDYEDRGVCITGTAEYAVTGPNVVGVVAEPVHL